jgi:O-antigen/teichoic acid export membrane protein
MKSLSMIARLTALAQHQGFRRYFANTSWLFGEKVLRMVVSLIVGVWVARYLGPERYGLFSYAQSFVGLFAVIATLGLNNILVRELVKDESRRDILLGTAFCLKLLGAAAVMLLLAAAVHFTSNDAYTNALVFIVASATVFQSFNVIDLYFQSRVLSRYVVFANTISLALLSLLKIACILLRAPLTAFAFLVLLDTIVLAAGFVFFYRQNKLSVRAWSFDQNTAKSLLKDSWPLILSGMVVAVYMKIDQVMIKEMLDSEAVGQYAAAVRISEAWYFIPMVICSSLFPAILNAKKQSEALYYSRLQRLYDMMVWMAIAVALPMTFLSDDIVRFLYGEAYSQSASVLMIHIWAGVFVGLGVASGKWYLSENLQQLLFLRTLCGGITNVALNIILIPVSGGLGAAIATLASQSMVCFFFDAFNEKTKNTFSMKLRSFNINKYIK